MHLPRPPRFGLRVLAVERGGQVFIDSQARLPVAGVVDQVAQQREGAREALPLRQRRQAAQRPG
jgi:hypothetical protein